MRSKDPVLLAVDDEQDIADAICAIAARAGFRALHCTAPRHLRALDARC